MQRMRRLRLQSSFGSNTVGHSRPRECTGVEVRHGQMPRFGDPLRARRRFNFGARG